MKIREYLPEFIEHEESDIRTMEFNTLLELYEIPFVKKKTEHPRFVGFEWSKMADGGEMLLWIINDPIKNETFPMIVGFLVQNSFGDLGVLEHTGGFR